MRLKKIIILGASLLPLLSLVACSEEKNAAFSDNQQTEYVERKVNPREYSQGQRLYQLNCSSCHGKQGEGAKNWQKRDKDGKNQPPPLNGTGHTWHHSPKALALVIRNGTGKIGGNMPAWKDKLSNREIELILGWITAQWPDEIYTIWYNQHHQQN
ncbi:MAG: cytochrome c [Gammaproteobacteria bacterium]|nr:cytochrome c [Gammaproteobacteria bacterium]